ncbi:MAG: type II toxin-antitoxin system YafQ family toxin, partial [Lachnospiraceae bacterium]
KAIIAELAKPAELPIKNKDHRLTGNYTGHRECHVLPDWLLIYYVSDGEIYLVRTGSHADLFGK